jgi:hypothetical protein
VLGYTGYNLRLTAEEIAIMNGCVPRPVTVPSPVTLRFTPPTHTDLILLEQAAHAPPSVGVMDGDAMYEFLAAMDVHLAPRRLEFEFL